MTALQFLTADERKAYEAELAAAGNDEAREDIIWRYIDIHLARVPREPAEDWTGLDAMWQNYVAESRARG